MTSSDHSITHWYRIGYAPVLTLTAMAALIVFAASIPVSGWRTTALFMVSMIASFFLLEVFVRQGERRGASPRQMRLVGFAVYVATATIAFLVRAL